MTNGIVVDNVEAGARYAISRANFDIRTERFVRDLKPGETVLGYTAKSIPGSTRLEDGADSEVSTDPETPETVEPSTEPEQTTSEPVEADSEEDNSSTVDEDDSQSAGEPTDEDLDADLTVESEELR